MGNTIQIKVSMHELDANGSFKRNIKNIFFVRFE